MVENSQAIRGEIVALHEAVLAITSELSLDKVLQKIVDVGRVLVDARYAALGVAGEDGHLIEFVTSGLAPTQAARIPNKPTGQGLLGVLFGAKRPMRIADIAAHPASVGFPENHPRMVSFLGVPLLLRGKVLGSLYLTDKEGAKEFTLADELLIEMLAAQAAVAVENARLFTESDEALRRKVADLQAERRKMKAIVDQMPEGVVIVDASGENIVLINRAASKLLGMENQAGGENSLRSLRPVGPDGELQVKESSLLHRVVAGGHSVVGEQMSLCRVDERCFTCLVNAAPLHDRDGVIVGGIVVFQDITGLRELDRLKDELISIISHEVRNPLTAIRGRAQLMLRVARRTPGREDDVTGLEAIDAQVEKLAEMVRELLDVSQMRLGLLELRRQPTDLVALARQTVEQFRAVNEQHSFELSAGTSSLVGHWDGPRLEQVLLNLLENAKKYSPAGSRVRVAVSEAAGSSLPVLNLDRAVNAQGARRPEQRWALVAVTDEGIGIPIEAREHLFDRFYRAANAKGRAESGLGLGLYICHEIVSQHGGAIWLDSSEGKGSTFYLTLPLDSMANAFSG